MRAPGNASWIYLIPPGSLNPIRNRNHSEGKPLLLDVDPCIMSYPYSPKYLYTVSCQADSEIFCNKTRLTVSRKALLGGKAMP